jgi:hypothetical protein
MIVPTLRVGMHHLTLRVPSMEWMHTVLLWDRL